MSYLNVHMMKIFRQKKGIIYGDIKIKFIFTNEMRM